MRENENKITGETFELRIKDGEGRLWDIKTDANRDIVASALRFLREIDNRRMVELGNLLDMYGYNFECELVRDNSIDFEM